MENKDYCYQCCKYEKQIYDICLQYTKDSIDAQDLVQETFKRFLESIDKFHEECSLKTWILGIAYNVCHYYYNQKLRNQKFNIISYDENDYLFEVLEDNSYINPLDKIIINEQYQFIDDVVQHLPNNQRIAYELKYTDYLQDTEIASIMGLSPNAVKKLNQRLRANIKEKININ